MPSTLHHAVQQNTRDLHTFFFCIGKQTNKQKTQQNSYRRRKSINWKDNLKLQTRDCCSKWDDSHWWFSSQLIDGEIDTFWLFDRWKDYKRSLNNLVWPHCKQQNSHKSSALCSCFFCCCCLLFYVLCFLFLCLTNFLSLIFFCWIDCFFFSVSQVCCQQVFGTGQKKKKNKNKKRQLCKTCSWSLFLFFCFWMVNETQQQQENQPNQNKSVEMEFKRRCEEAAEQGRQVQGELTISQP